MWAWAPWFWPLMIQIWHCHGKRPERKLTCVFGTVQWNNTHMLTARLGAALWRVSRVVVHGVHTVIGICCTKHKNAFSMYAKTHRKMLCLNGSRENFSFTLSTVLNCRPYKHATLAELSTVVNQPNRPLYRLSQGEGQAWCSKMQNMKTDSNDCRCS